MTNSRGSAGTNQKGWMVVGAVVLAVLIGTLVLRGASSGSESAYRTATATVSDLEMVVTAVGKLQPRETVDVGAQVSGQLTNIAIEIGDEVEKGQLLAEIDPAVLEARVAADEAQLRELRATLSQRRAEHRLASVQAARNERLRAQDAISAQDTEATEAALEVAAAQVEQIEAQIERVTSTLNEDRTNLNYTKIYAPMSGTIVSVSASEGQTLNANQAAPVLMQIADLGEMVVEAEVSETDVSRLTPGMPARFNTLGDAERQWTSTVRQVLPQPEVVNDVVLYKALLDVMNEGRVLLPEMSAQVFFIEDKAEQAVSVPLAALQRRPAGGRSAVPQTGEGDGASAPDLARRTGPFAARAEATPAPSAALQTVREAKAQHPDGEVGMVLVMTDGELRPRPVLVGLKTRTDAEILEGLKVGEAVVIGEVAPAPAAARRQNGARPGGFPPPMMGR
ncbi:efflux RND transporter periplasmic adaptor subunit [Parvularcula dongshanensis]|uniref:Macrolide-specific efflux system membrane fusion protein n=1 Tax=Parvularcula dongshanensis TaxID=1173995 RepID=A0A840I8D4_9PROT|nr:efflux RND transporter periplasmic adaptor subunit [Parvularcula dongshanensis]MBB4660414.1 macrolide-specific efflux system membrane fusion protein [Parvularcula dongshanensis]